MKATMIEAAAEAESRGATGSIPYPPRHTSNGQNQPKKVFSSCPMVQCRVPPAVHFHSVTFSLWKQKLADKSQLFSKVKLLPS